jgi:DNA-binding NtrC family response regulator
MNARILVVDDDPASCRLVRAIFSAEGDEVVAAHDAAAALELAERSAPDLVLLDLHLPGAEGLSVLEALVAAAPDRPVVMLTAHADVRTAVGALHRGAADFVTKPYEPEALVVVVRRALETGALRREVAALRRRLDGPDEGLAASMGSGPLVVQLEQQVRTVAGTPLSVLVLGETGTGKELVARAVHRLGPRRGGPFVAVDCGALPEALLESELFGHERGAFTGADRRKDGRFVQAAGGTLFLDEIGNLPLGLQSKLLRVLESREVQPLGAVRPVATDVRVVAATNDDLPRRAASGAFRADLYYRLAQYTITLPPLRARPGDVPALARRFVAEASAELGVAPPEIPEAWLRHLEARRWEGNVRELRNVARRFALDGRTDGEPAPAPPEPPQPAPGGSLREIAAAAAEAAERTAILAALRAARGNQAEAARALRTDWKTLHLKIKKLRLRPRDFGD